MVKQFLSIACACMVVFATSCGPKANNGENTTKNDSTSQANTPKEPLVKQEDIDAKVKGIAANIGTATKKTKDFKSVKEKDHVGTLTAYYQGDKLVKLERVFTSKMKDMVEFYFDETGLVNYAHVYKESKEAKGTKAFDVAVYYKPNGDVLLFDYKEGNFEGATVDMSKATKANDKFDDFMAKSYFDEASKLEMFLGSEKATYDEMVLN